MQHVNANRMTIMGIGGLLQWTHASSFELVVRQSHGRPQRCQNRGESRRGDRSPKTYELGLFTMIMYNSENSIRNTRPFCQLLFCYSSVVTWDV